MAGRPGALRQHRKRQAEERLAAAPGEWQDGGYVFTEPDGQPIHPQRLTRHFTRAVKEAGLPRIGLHGLRHTAATSMIGAGVPINLVSQRLGHANVSVTLSTYAHALPSEDAIAAAVVDRTLLTRVAR